MSDKQGKNFEKLARDFLLAGGSLAFWGGICLAAGWAVARALEADVPGIAAGLILFGLVALVGARRGA